MRGDVLLSGGLFNGGENKIKIEDLFFKKRVGAWRALGCEEPEEEQGRGACGLLQSCLFAGDLTTRE